MRFEISNRLHGTARASAIPGCKHLADVTGVDTSAVLKRLIRQYQAYRRPVSVNFRRILPSLNSADRFAHLIHPYPAKLLVHIPFLFLANDLLSKPNDVILDPFCGSGTVLSEAQLAGRQAYGADANPLARLIAHVKTTPLDILAAQRALKSVLRRMPLEPPGTPPDVVNLKHWFYPKTIQKLQCLLEAIQAVKTSSVRDFFLVCFSACVRKVSLADPRLSVPVRLKFGQYPKGHPLREKTDSHLRRLRRVNVGKVFNGIACTNIARMKRIQVCSIEHPKVELLCSDARRLVHEFSANGALDKRLPDESVQLIITSPPYPGAQKYVRACSLSLGWLGLCRVDNLRASKACIIGREEFAKGECERLPLTHIPEADRLLARIRKKSPIRATIAATYLNDMRSAFSEMRRVLKCGGHIVLVAANNRIGGQQFRTVNYLQAVAQECGLCLSAWFVDSIRSRGLMTKRNKTASMITRESVLIFSKGDLTI